MKLATQHSSGKVISFVILGTAILLGSCESFLKMAAWPEPYSIPRGTIFINQDLPIKPNEVSVWIQFGKIVDRRNIKKRYPNCHFELFTLKPTNRSIYKDNVQIIKFVHNTDYVAASNIMLASLVQISSDGNPMVEIFTTNIYLISEMQPDLYRLVCEHWEDPSTGIFLTMQQIRETLGGIATIQAIP